MDTPKEDGGAAKAPDYAEIWLEPNCGSIERSWCQDNVWERGCEACGAPPTKYIREDIAAVNEREALLKCEAALRAVIDATRAYLPPDGISIHDCIQRILGATDNKEIVAALSHLEKVRSHGK